MNHLFSRYRNTIAVRIWSFFKVPLLYGVRPSVIELNDERVIVSIPLLRRNKNHLNSMYVGALVIGADIAGALLAFKKSLESDEAVSVIFKDFKGEFYLRPEDRTVFVCADGEKITQVVSAAINSGERENATVKVDVTCPNKTGDKLVAQFYLTLSVKKLAHKKSKFVEIFQFLTASRSGKQA